MTNIMPPYAFEHKQINAQVKPVKTSVRPIKIISIIVIPPKE